jgi:hypothetical protein
MNYALDSNTSEPTFFLFSPTTPDLTAYLEAALTHFCHYSSSNETGFFTQLHIIADCYRLVLAATCPHLSSLDTHLQTFMDFLEAGKPKEDISSVALSVSHLIFRTAQQIRLLSLPWYQDHFISAIDYLLSDRIAYLQPDPTASEKLRKTLLPKLSRRSDA